MSESAGPDPALGESRNRSGGRSPQFDLYIVRIVVYLDRRRKRIADLGLTQISVRAPSRRRSTQIA
jgi:hypothetical protein